MISDEEILAGCESVGHASGPHFIAISYNGLTDAAREGGKIVTVGSYEEQIQALKASGYQTITQQDIINYYKNGTALPEKAMLLIFEDGILYTTELAQPAMIANNYIATACTFAENLSDTEDLYITADGIKKLNKTTYWETGSNGYRVSYINVFDRYENYFGELSTREFLAVHDYLRRDYNHYLMDYYHASDTAMNMLEHPASDVTILQEDDRIAFVPNKPLAGMIFYPGGKVEAASYAPLCRRIASNKNKRFMTKKMNNGTAAAASSDMLPRTECRSDVLAVQSDARRGFLLWKSSF